MPESMTDQSVTAWLARLVAKVEEEQQNAAEALHRLARAAEADAASVVTVPPEAWFATYRKQAEEVGRVLDRLDAARYDVTVCSQVRAARLATRDTESSASRQHYIDTGDYLDKDAS